MIVHPRLVRGWGLRCLLLSLDEVQSLGASGERHVSFSWTGRGNHPNDTFRSYTLVSRPICLDRDMETGTVIRPRAPPGLWERHRSHVLELRV